MPRVKRSESDTTRIVLPKDFACIKIKKEKEEFHKNSFRFVPMPGPGNEKATIVVGCPLRNKRGEFRWEPKERATVFLRHDKGRKTERTIKGVCYNPDGAPHGTRRHAVIKTLRRGAVPCGKGYRKMPMKSISAKEA